MVEFTQGDVVAWLATGPDIIHLAAQAQIDQEVVARVEIIGEFTLQHTLVDQGLDTLTGTAIHDPCFHGEGFHAFGNRKDAGLLDLYLAFMCFPVLSLDTAKKAKRRLEVSW